MQVIAKCTTCGEEFLAGPGAMQKMDDHERSATQVDPEFRDHWVRFTEGLSSE